MTYQLNILDLIEEGKRRKEAGIQQAADHADKVNTGWTNQAFNLFTAWVKNKGTGRQFKGEDFRVHVELGESLPKPPHDRAYGSIMLKAARAGLIKKVGYTQTVSPSSHRANCSLWETI